MYSAELSEKDKPNKPNEEKELKQLSQLILFMPKLYNFYSINNKNSLQILYMKQCQLEGQDYSSKMLTVLLELRFFGAPNQSLCIENR